MTATQPDPRRVIRKLNLIGLSMVAVLIGGVGGWATTSQLAGAVIAPGTIVVESNIKKVQHPTGGVVGQILVKEGSEVNDGDVVLRLDDTVTRSTLGVVRSSSTKHWPGKPDLQPSATPMPSCSRRDWTSRRDDPSVAMALAGEERLFESRRTRAGRAALAAARTRRATERGDSRPVGATGGEGKRARADRDGARRRCRSLQEESTPFPLHAAAARPDAAAGRARPVHRRHRRARGKISETELQIIQVDQDFRTEVLKDCARRKARSPSSRNASPPPRTSSSASTCARRRRASCTSSPCTRWAA